MNLAAKKCLPCDGKLSALDEAGARELAAQVPAWSLDPKKPRISREFTFPDFVAAMKFVNAVAALAESEGHHPDLHIHWNRVKLVLWTHDLGGLSENDFVLAAKIDGLTP
jgi:4a-hydroxytetrahydrobiopterin dehydratase